MSDLGEFDLIERYFKRPAQRSAVSRQQPSRVALGMGDDCALLAPAVGMQLAVSTDMLVEGRHFLSTVDPERLGHKALAVNLSDLAACGAKPVAFTLSLALPAVDENWLAGFSKGLFALADEHGCELMGGDTTRGPLTISITVFGEVPTGRALLRSGAKAGDDVWVSGSLGDARLALEVFRGTLSLPTEQFELARRRMEQPTPRVMLGQLLRGLASAAVDVSDGLIGDLKHVLAASRVGATLDADAAVGLITTCANSVTAASLNVATLRTCALAGGDDYELVFTAPVAARDAIERAGIEAATPVTRIGHIEALTGLRIVDASSQPVVQDFNSFDHFTS
jgi:thiamine-monophosphate kinase